VSSPGVSIGTFFISKFNMQKKEVLFICLSDGKKLDLRPKDEVEKDIRAMERNPDYDLTYNVLGSVQIPFLYKEIPFLIQYKIEGSTMYDVIYAKEGVEAHVKLLKKKRLQGKEVKITNTLDLRKLIDEYYE
jgi:hypothetical protein